MNKKINIKKSNKKDNKTNVEIKKDNKKDINIKKEKLTVQLIQQNKLIDKLLKNMNQTLQEYHKNENNFNGQRELIARVKMTERILYSSINMISQNKLKLWMIDEKALEE